MIIRSLFRGFSNQDWSAVIIELLVVAVGIFMGLQASNWNDARIERALERGYLIRLHEDMLASAEGIERDNEFMERQLADQEVILAALDSCQVTADQALPFQRGIGSLGFLNKPRFFRRTIDDLAATGRIDIIQSDQIRAELARIVADAEWRGSVMESSFRMVNHLRSLIDEQVRYDISVPIEGWSFSTKVDFDIQSLCSRPGNASAISAVSFHTRDRLMAFRDLGRKYRSILPLIEAELLSRWGHEVGSAE